MFLLLSILLVVVVTRLLKLVTSAAIAEFLWTAYTELLPSEQVKLVKSKRKRVVEVRTARANTSSKDEFAKWARLDREYSKLKAELDELNAGVGTQRLKIQSAVATARWVLTSGVTLYVQWRYRKVPVLWLPKGMVPGLLEWFFSLPFAPRGSISVASWVIIAGSSVDSLMWAVAHLFTALRVRKAPAPVPATATATR